MPPITVMIKPVSGACNMRCRYCFYADEMKNRACAVRPPMSLETLETVVRRALAYAEGQANFIFQGGEPTLIGLDYYRRLIALENRYGGRGVEINNMLQTNGYALSDEMIAFFAENHFLLGVSLDGCPAAHDLMRPDAQGEGTYARVARTIERLEGAGAEYNILCVVNAAVAARADETLSALSKYRYLQFIPCLDALEGGAGDYALSPRAWGEFLIKAFDFYEQAYNAQFRRLAARDAGGRAGQLRHDRALLAELPDRERRRRLSLRFLRAGSVAAGQREGEQLPAPVRRRDGAALYRGINERAG